jgi:hypothetical protein
MKSILALLLVSVSLIVSGQKPSPQYYSLVKKADSLFQRASYLQSGLVYSEAFKTFGGKGKIPDRYEAARAWVMAGHPDSALSFLKKITPFICAVDFKEEDFVALQADKRWKPVLNNIKLHDVGKWLKHEQKTNGYFLFCRPDTMEHKYISILRSAKKDIKNEGTFLQILDPESYLVKKIRFSGKAKSKDLTETATFFASSYGPDSKDPAFSDNMSERPVKGNSDWSNFDIVIYIPSYCNKLIFGARLKGGGEILFRDLNVEIVGADTPLTGDKD